MSLGRCYKWLHYILYIYGGKIHPDGKEENFFPTLKVKEDIDNVFGVYRIKPRRMGIKRF